MSRMMPASDPKQSWWMTITEWPKGNSCSQKEIIEERKNRNAKVKTTGDHKRLQDATGGNRASSRAQILAPRGKLFLCQHC